MSSPPTPDLAAAPGGEPKRIAQLEQALRETRDCIINGGGGGVCDTVWYHGSPAETLVDYIDSQLGIPASMSASPAAETAPDVGLVEALRELSEAAYDGEWEFARREGDEQAPAAIFVRGYNAPIAIAISPRLGVEQFERDARFIIAAVRFARAALSRAGEPKPTAPDAGLVEALRKLVANYDHFCTTSGNQADAYYSLVKSHHGDWEAARAALARAGERND